MDYQTQNTRYCSLRGHEDNKASFIQIYKEGQKTQEWLCVDCIRQYFDNNGHPELNHDMKQNLFLDFIKQQSQPIYDQSMEEKKLIQFSIKGLQQGLQSTQSLIYQLQEDLITIDKNYNMKIKEIEEIINLTKQDHNLLKNQQIDKLINLNDCNKKYDQVLLSDLLKQLIQNYLDLEKQLQNKNNNDEKNNIITKVQFKQSTIMKDGGNQIQGVSKQTINQRNENIDIINQCNQNNCDTFIKNIEVKNRKYISQVIDQNKNRIYYKGSSISKNEQYLAYGGDGSLLKIYEINQKKIIKKIQLGDDIYCCQFTQDSSQLYVGLKGGYVCGYEVKDDFKEIYQQQIHQITIYNIITIQNEYLITCSADKTIIKTDIKSKQQIFKLNGHTATILAIDYDDKDEIIVSGSDDKSIKLWNCVDQSIIINKKRSHNSRISQIQLINNNLYILSLDNDGNLYKWKIDLTNKDLEKIQQFIDENEIFNFYQVNQDQNLLLICKYYVKILNQQGETINTMKHGGHAPVCHDCRQIDNLKYIQIRAYSQIMLLIAQD